MLDFIQFEPFFSLFSSYSLLSYHLQNYFSIS